VGQDGTNLVVAVVGPVLAGFENGFRRQLRREISKTVPSNRNGEDVRGMFKMAIRRTRSTIREWRSSVVEDGAKLGGRRTKIPSETGG
jgi:hypothetical protein